MVNRPMEKQIQIDFGDEYVVLPIASHRINANELAQFATSRQIANGEILVKFNAMHETLVVFPRYAKNQAFIYGLSNELFISVS